ncbi:hypothetical protein [uncultured Sulfitobacter sp.]|uniref:hypothetical protein n=1 Tax=uncultured Sulfitobacter sp. TaxID=191468 RepID=UPI0026375A01|nr:hypothetical protein [uncultured Sulfitobacter sp.]
MSVSLKTQKILWGKAAARCAMPDCRRRLVENNSETDDPTLVGENCHIVAEKDGGPRSDPKMPVQDGDRYANLVLLCNVHHKIIDDNEAIWTGDRLKTLKSEHESWVEESLDLDTAKIRDDTVYADYVDEWVGSLIWTVAQYGAVGCSGPGSRGYSLKLMTNSGRCDSGYWAVSGPAAIRHLKAHFAILGEC